MDKRMVFPSPNGRAAEEGIVMGIRHVELLIFVIAGTMCALWFWRFYRHFVPVLLYHFFVEGSPTNLLEVRLEVFSRQLRLLRALGFHCISLSSLLTDRNRPRRAVVITVDDGEISFFERALPVLKEFGFPITAFVVVDSLSRGFFQAGTKVRVAATWEQLRDLLSTCPKLDIGCHSWSHRVLTACSHSELLQELNSSAEVLYQGLGRKPEYFAYPYGRWNCQLADEVCAAGYIGACSTTWGDAFRRDRFCCEREPIYANTAIWQFALKILGFYSFARNLPGFRYMRGRRWHRATT
jgi:peptidoglycan/xylan/chitin deacetylase (PgdA/CDA1 family)